MPPTYGSGPQQPVGDVYGSQPPDGSPYGSQWQPSYSGQPSPYAQQPGPAVMPGQPLPESAYGSGSAMFWRATESERSTAMWTHIGTIFLGWIMPLIMFLVKKDDSAFVREHSRRSLNAQIMNAILTYGIIFISIPLMFILVGFITIWLAFLPPILYAIFEIIAAVSANKGEVYRIPLAPDMVK